MDKFLDKRVAVQATQGNLPHWNQEGKIYFVTYRLYDSLPQSKLEEFRSRKTLWLEQHQQPWSEDITKEYHREFSQYIDKWLDANYGDCILRKPEIAAIVESNLLYNNDKKYILHSYVIMPNHVHVLVELLEGHTIQSIMHSWKSYSGNQINKILDKTGSVWRRESFDRIIRDENHYFNIRNYIIKNTLQCGVRWMI